MNEPLLKLRLMRRFFDLSILVHPIPLLLCLAIVDRQKLPPICWQDQLLNSRWGQAQESFSGRYLGNFFGEPLNQTWDLFRVGFEGGNRQKNPYYFGDIWEVDQVSKDIEERSLKQDGPHPRAAEAKDSYVWLKIP